MRGCSHKLFLTVGFLWLVSCSQTLEIPKLPRGNQPAISHVVLSDHLAPGDLRSIFRALNHDGKLAGLKPWLEDPTDEELSWVTDFLSHQVYENAFDRKGLIALVESSNQRKAFSSLENETRSWASSRQAEKEMLWKAAASPQFTATATAITPLVNPTLDGFYRALGKKRTESEAPTPAALVEDAKKILHTPSLKEFAVTHAVQWQEAETLDGVLKGLARSQAKYGSRGFNAINASFRNNKKDLAAFFSLIRLLDRPSRGLFTALEKNLHSRPDEVANLAVLLEPSIVRSAGLHITQVLTEFSQDKLDKEFWLNFGSNPKPTSIEFKSVFRSVLDGLGKLLNIARTDPDKNRFVEDLPLNLNAYALTKWLAHVHSNSKFREIIELPATQSLSALWDLQGEVKPFDFDFSQKDGNAFVVVSDLRSLGLDKIAGALEYHLSVGDIVRPIYSVEGGTLNLNEALRLAAEESQNVFRIGDPTALFTAMVESIAFGELETENMLESLLSYVGGISTPLLSRQLRFLLDDVGIRKMDPQTRNLILSFLDNSEQKFGESVFDQLPSLGALVAADRKPEEALQLLQPLIQGNADEMGPFKEMLCFAGQLPLARKSSELPAVDAWLTNGSGLGTHWENLAVGALSQQRRLAGVALSNLLGHMETLWTFAAEVVENSPAGIASLFEHGSVASLAEWSPQEREWLIAFVQMEDFSKIVRFLSARGSRAQGHQALLSAIELAQSGALRDAFALLSRIQSERMQRVAATFGAWENSGELLAFLRSLDVLVSP